MYKKTSNPYSLKYIRTGISGPGIPQVYLPPQPAPEKIAGYHLPQKDQKFYPTPLPAEYRKWVGAERANPDFIHPQKAQFEAQEWERRLKGYWFYNNGVPTYITGLHYYYLNYWKVDFRITYRETNKELFYLLQFVEEDPDCYGLAYNTKRRDGKSTIMGCWQTEYVTRTKFANGGIQDRTDKLAAKFFRARIMNPFRKLPGFFQPEYDTSTTQKTEIYFQKTTAKGKKADFFLEENEDLESRIDFRASTEESYDGDKLHRYVCEEPGKKTDADVYDRHDVVKWCLYDNDTIIGKMLYATTVELEEGEEDNKAYKRLYYDSDYDVRPALNQTKSGLYAAFLPAYYADNFDDYGHPRWEYTKARQEERRKSLEKDPKAYAKYVRKFPWTIGESFYTSGKKCVFNARILEKRKDDLNFLPHILTRGNFKWKDGIKDSTVYWEDDPRHGKWQVAYLFEKESDSNRVGHNELGFHPLNNARFRSSIDPIDHGVVNDMGKASTPVSLVKRLFDPDIDPIGDLKEMADAEYEYQTNRYICLYDHRPLDQKIVYEDMIKQCVYFGCWLHAENNKKGIIDFFNERGYSQFIMKRPEATYTAKGKPNNDEGTPSSHPIIQQYTEHIETYVEYFGHTIPFVEVIEDLLDFNPKKTQFYDYTVAMGFCELAGLKRMTEEKETLNLEEIIPIFDRFGNVVN